MRHLEWIAEESGGSKLCTTDKRKITNVCMETETHECSLCHVNYNLVNTLVAITPGLAATLP